MPKVECTIFEFANGSKFQKIFTEFPSPKGGNTLYSLIFSSNFTKTMIVKY